MSSWGFVFVFVLSTLFSDITVSVQMLLVIPPDSLGAMNMAREKKWKNVCLVSKVPSL